jgi:hypothetical protein
MMRKWNVLNAEDPSNSSVDKTGKFLIQEALSVTAEPKPMKIVCNFLSHSFLKENIFLAHSCLTISMFTVPCYKQFETMDSS